MGNILFQAGTGELEIMEFTVAGQNYAINVLKLRGIIQIDNITHVPQSRPEIAGLSNIRGEMRTVIDLKMLLNGERNTNHDKLLGLLCEFNDITLVFLVDNVEGIRRINWTEIKPNSNLQNNPMSVGTMLIDDNIVIMLDFESISMTLGVSDEFKISESLQTGAERDEFIVIAEDSAVIRNMMINALSSHGYRNIQAFQNGQEAMDYINRTKDELGKEFRQVCALLVTDIEMPQMDGYTLTKKIKDDPIIRNLPIIIFSSLVREELAHKGISVGVDIQISKPSINELLFNVDNILAQFPVY